VSSDSCVVVASGSRAVFGARAQRLWLWKKAYLKPV
jgi:hypothetical protein